MSHHCERQNKKNKMAVWRILWLCSYRMQECFDPTPAWYVSYASFPNKSSRRCVELKEGCRSQGLLWERNRLSQWEWLLSGAEQVVYWVTLILKSVLTSLGCSMRCSLHAVKSTYLLKSPLLSSTKSPAHVF